ncbi:Uncharacterised protein [Raoultella terrigena]|uniref:Uncharacterized protein n=1 Tax=Raoultella terrigena TaxID=577 RepID=A0A4U9CSL3_RAOTE|nr:Uncharacterised protein [Raoultella terrigena]
MGAHHLRNKAFAFAFFIQFLSVPAVALMSWMLVPITLFGLSGWRWVIIFGAALLAGYLGHSQEAAGIGPLAGSQRPYDDAHAVMCEMEQRCGIAPRRSTGSRPGQRKRRPVPLRRFGRRSIANAPSC